MTDMTTSPNQITLINNVTELRAFHAKHKLRDDWHEPEEQGVSAFIIGNHLDNAMGSSATENCGEFNIILTAEAENDDVEGTQVVINLATLLSWATRGN